MNVTYTSEKYDPNKSYVRYVRKDWDGAYHWCEVGVGDEDAKRRDYRQGKADASEIPEAIRDAADALCGYFPSYVDWPYARTCRITPEVADILERLRTTWGPRDYEVTDLCKEAADEIEWLRAALKITTEKLITSWSGRDLAPDDELELVESNAALLKD